MQKKKTKVKEDKNLKERIVMEFKIYFNDNNSIGLLDEKLQIIGLYELLQRLKESDYNEDHEIEFYTPDNNKIHLEVNFIDDVVNDNLYQINVETIYDDKHKDNEYLNMDFKITEVDYNIGSIPNMSSSVKNYDVFNNEMNDIINEWWKSTVNISVNDEFRIIFNAILKIEIQRAIGYRFNNFTKIQEYLQICRDVLADQKLEIEQKIDSYSILLSKLDNESKRINLRK